MRARVPRNSQEYFRPDAASRMRLNHLRARDSSTTEGREAVSITLTKYYKSSAEPWVVLHIDQDRDVSDPA